MNKRGKNKIKRRMLSGVMAAVMVLSAMDVSSWGVMNAKAETTLAKNVPESLAIYSNESSTWQRIDIIKNGVLQDDGVANNEATEYKGTNWYYDGAKNKLVLENASIESISVENGDLTILSSGENTLSGYIHSKSSNGEHTLELKGDNSGCLTVGKTIQDVSDTGQQMNLKITDATVKAQEITCIGSMRIENSRVIVSAGDGITYYAMKADSDINITNSYVEVKQNRDRYAISTTNNGIVVSNSQIMACNSGIYEEQVIEGGSFSDSVVTKHYGNNVTKSVVYGTASLIEKLTIPNDGTIVFMQGASITNQELLAVEDGATVLVNGYMIEDVEASGDIHTHNTDGSVTYTW